MANVFISYSRKDQVFARRLFDRLTDEHLDTWADWEGIPYSAEWWEEIKKGIEEAQSFVCVLSPSYITSKICNDELAYARSLGKRIIPIVRRMVRGDDGQFLPEIRSELYGKAWAALVEENVQAVSRLNFVFFRKRSGFNCEYDEITKQVTNPECDSPQSDADDFETAFQGLLATTRQDPVHVEEHTRLIVRARQWENNDRDPSFLLHDNELRKAEHWLEFNRYNSPEPTQLHRDYIQASIDKRAEREKLEAERALRERALERRFRRALRALVLVFFAATIVASVLFIIAVNWG